MQWKDVTIRQYQEKIYPITSRKVSNEADELDQATDLMVLLDGQGRAHYDDMIAARFNELFAQYEFLLALPKPEKIPQFVIVKNILFACDYNPANVKYKLKARDIIDLTTLSKDEKQVVDNMHRILAAYLVQEKKAFGKRMDEFAKAEFIKDCDMQTTWNILAFFLPLLENCSVAILNYLKTLPEKTKEE